jgi:hypothetical protein
LSISLPTPLRNAQFFREDGFYVIPIPLSKALLKVRVTQMMKKFPPFYGTQIYTNAHQWTPT